MMEVFIFFTQSSDIRELESTLEAWNLVGLEPIAIQAKPNKFELHRRVTSEMMSNGDYIIASLGYGPVEENFAKLAMVALDTNPDAGLILPDGIAMAAICRKGVVTHWPIPQSSTYMREHSEAYSHVGYKTISCKTIHCLPLAVSLPS